MNEQPERGDTPTAIKVALIGAAATVLVAIITGVFALLQSKAARPEPTPPPAAKVTTPSIDIDGPLTAPLDERTYFTLVSENAARAEWSIGGFAGNEVFTVDPLPNSYQIYIEPTDAGRVEDSFTLVVTVYDAAGQTATARHEFQIVEGGARNDYRPPAVSLPVVDNIGRSRPLARPLDQPPGGVLVQDAGHQRLVGDAFLQRDLLQRAQVALRQADVDATVFPHGRSGIGTIALNLLRLVGHRLQVAAFERF